MVERSYSLNIPGAEATDLRIALYEQKELVQQLQEELDAEREAAASSASEALAMILRLQGEKASLAMEASQYKRMVEERMSHAEMSLAFLEDLIYQKELEITALEYQVQAYRCKLLSLGCSDFAGADVKLQEHNDLTLKVNNPSLFVQTGDSGGRISDIRCDRSQTPSPEPVLDLSVPVEKGVIEQSMDSRRYSDNSLSPPRDLDSYWEQIKKLDERVKEITDFRDSLREKYKMLKHDSVTVSKSEKGEKFEDLASSSNVQDVFEVPQTKEKAKGISIPDMPPKMVPKQKRLEKKSSKQLRDRSVKRDRARGSCANDAEYQAELQRLRERIERLEVERRSEVTEISGVERGEETSLLRQIKEELSFVQSEMESLRTSKKSPPRDDPSLQSLQEAMLYFWL